MIAALYVLENGPYYGLPDVDPWPESRDARKYAGPWPVVAHPPCARWCQLAALNEARYGHKIGDDGGCFAAALAAVRKWGGVLEHPAYSIAWKEFGLPRPLRRGMWDQSLWDHGWVTSVAQSAYGHPARKRTWLYYVGPKPEPLRSQEPKGEAWVSWADFDKYPDRKRLSKKAALETPQEFRNLLLDLARSASPDSP